MRVIMLDIDGVLNSDETFKEWRKIPDHELLPRNSRHLSNCICPKMVAHLNHIVDSTGAKCVLSSTWRLLEPMDWISQHLKNFGFRGEIIDKTPKLMHSSAWCDDHQYERWHEINAWLECNKELGVTSYVILDDLSEADNRSGRFVKTNEEIGLTRELADKAISILNG